MNCKTHAGRPIMEQVIWGLAAAFISAIAWIAYKHPRAYRKNIFVILMVLNVVGSAIPLAFLTGKIHAKIIELYEKTQSIEDNPRKNSKIIDIMEYNMRSTIKDLYNDYWLVLYIIFTFGGVSAYLLTLYYIPNLLEIEEKSDDEK